MKNYTELNLTSPLDLAVAFNEDLAEIELPIAAKHRLLGECQITAIRSVVTDQKADIYVTINDKQYSLSVLLNLKLLTLDPEILAILDTYSKTLTEALQIVKAYDLEQKRLRAEESKKAKAAAVEAKKLEEKKRQLENKIKNMQPINLTTDYELIGWMASHVNSISATVNSDYEAWFQKNFGAVDHTVIDANEKTRNGDPMKYSLSFRAGFKSDIPAVLQSREGVSTRAINSVEYIWDLIEKYGFRFGKTQDVAAIRKLVPDTYLEDFERGFSSDPIAKKTKKAKAEAAA